MESGEIHDVVTKKLALGVCLQEEECSFDSNPADMPRFDMGQLQNPLAWPYLGWKDKIIMFIQTKGTFICLLVIIIEGSRFCTFIFLLIQTSALYGIRTAQAIAYTVL